MDRISALRNVEDALSEFESGEADLAATERRVLTVLRTFATEFEDGDLDAYRASGSGQADGLVVVADSASQARERIADIADAADPAFEVERLD
jgi:ABC-type amino acid transport substrate-binding protein